MNRVVYLVPELVNCGPLNVVLNIIKFLDKDIIDPYIVALRRSSDFDLYVREFQKYLGVDKIYYLDDCVEPLVYLKEIIKNKKINCIHSHGYYPDKFSSGLNNIKKISTIHSMFYKDYPKEYGRVKGFFGAYSHFKILKRGSFDYTVGCSKSVSEYCMNHGVKDNIYTINNGVDHNVFKRLSEQEKYKARAELNIIASRIFIYSGRFIRRKRVPELLKLFLDNSQGSDLLILLGDGPERKKCEALYANNKIRFLGQVSNPEKFYQISDFVISNSDSEGYPMSIIEAVSCGCYALLSNIPSHEEFISQNPKLASLLDFSNENLIKGHTSNCELMQLSANVMSRKYMDLYLTKK